MRYLLVLIVVTFALQGCRRGPTNVLLTGGYSLSSYEAVSDDRYYIVSGEQKVVVPTIVQTIAVQGDQIYGYLAAIPETMFDPMPSGYYLIDTSKETVKSGLTWSELLTDLPTASKRDLRDASDYTPKFLINQ